MSITENKGLLLILNCVAQAHLTLVRWALEPLIQHQRVHLAAFKFMTFIYRLAVYVEQSTSRITCREYS